MERSMSFTSANLARGGFPEEAKAPENMIQVALLFDDRGPPTDEALIESVVRPMLSFHRMNSIIVPDKRATRPVGGGEGENSEVDPKKLIRRFKIASRGDQKVFDTIMQHMDDPLSHDRVGGEELPWWELLVIENKAKKGTSAVFLRTHHALGDGLSLVSVFQQICTKADGSPVSKASFVPERLGSNFGSQKPWFQLWWEVLVAIPKQLGIASGPYDDPTPFKAPPGPELIYSGNRELIRFINTPLGFLKELKKAADVSLNDIIYTCVSQAIYDYIAQQDKTGLLESKGSKLRSRSMLPVALPRFHDTMMDGTETLRNKWVFLSVDLAVGYSDIMDRLQHINATTSQIKSSPLVPVAWKIQETIPPLLPENVNAKIVLDTFQRHSLVHSNVPGPPYPLAVAGVEVMEVHPILNNILPQTAFLSYRDWVFGNLVIDPEVLPNIAPISIYYSRAMMELATRLEVDVPKEIRLHASTQVTLEQSS